jgi:tRNA pseudouridine38-40 synthase
VHARGQVVGFQFHWEHTTEDLRNALNYYLPKDMAVQSAALTDHQFHPRYDAKSRHYCYSIFCQPARDPLKEDYAWRVWPPVEVDRMNKAAESLIGVHDFCAFGSPTSENGSTIREVFSANWTREGSDLKFDISANAFLYHMVRRITFVLVTIGQEEANISLVEESLANGQLALRGLAPAEGLVLEEVIY